MFPELAGWVEPIHETGKTLLPKNGGNMRIRVGKNFDGSHFSKKNAGLFGFGKEFYCRTVSPVNCPGTPGALLPGRDAMGCSEPE